MHVCMYVYVYNLLTTNCLVDNTLSFSLEKKKLSLISCVHLSL